MSLSLSLSLSLLNFFKNLEFSTKSIVNKVPETLNYLLLFRKIHIQEDILEDSLGKNAYIARRGIPHHCKQ
jgi:hypothetical protein